jgi:DNA repair protein RadC
LTANAVSIIVFRTRASGDAKPTGEDWQLTGTLVRTGRVLGIPVNDHLIVANGERWVSLYRQQPW